VQGTFFYKDLILYPGILPAYLNGPTGDLWKKLHNRGQLAVAMAKSQVGVKTGALRNSIHMRHLGNFTGQYLWIGSMKNYALMHHEGTKPHMIFPKEHEYLRFRAGSRIIYTRQVRHPGTKPNRYLSDQLKVFGDIATIRAGVSNGRGSNQVF